jgi:glutamate formiminotransferase/formiminotetrahydrofolate cyclodeaminase
MAAFGLPKATDAERAARQEAVEAATRRATEVPLRTMRAALASMDVLRAMAEHGNPNAASDVGVGVLCARTALRGAYFNVQTNVRGLRDRDFVERTLAECVGLATRGEALEAEVLAMVQSVLDG